jgi:hypothetical protein
VAAEGIEDGLAARRPFELLEVLEKGGDAAGGGHGQEDISGTEG